MKGSESRMRVAVFAEVDMNLVDGSSVWVQSVCLTLASLPDVDVTLLLRVPPRRDLLTRPLDEHPRIEVVAPSADALAGKRLLGPEAAVAELERLDAERRFDVVLLRGRSVTDAAVAGGALDGRLWLYYIPAEDEDAPTLRRRLAAAHRVLCQTDWIRERVVAAVPEAAEQVVLLPPMVPPGDEQLRARPVAAGPALKLLYAGKFAPEYFFLETLELFRRYREHVPEATLHLLGDKVHNPPAEPGFKPAAERALAETPGVIWHGAVAREEVAQLLSDADVALSVRHPAMDSSTELSTKVLEYGRAGVAVLLNRNPVHAGLLGGDYPLLVSDLDDGLRALLAAGDPELRQAAADRCFAASRDHTFDRVAARLEPHLPRRSRAHATARDRPRVLLAGHDLKFASDIAALAREAGAEVREDRWTKHNVHDEAASLEALDWADTILCEWCLGNAIFYSARKRPEQRLVVRFHRMELETAYPASVELDNVDAMVFVAHHVLDQARERFEWPESSVFRLVENTIDTAGLERPKLPGAEFNLGFVGFVPMLKRLDRALDIVELVRLRDDRYRLVVKGRPPWDFAWMLKRDTEREFYTRLYERIERAPLLRGAVSFEPFGSDVTEFLQKCGWIFSTSEIEGHAVALGEGMASGAIPVVLERPGADRQYPAEWVHASPEDAARAILDVAARGATAAEGARAREHAQRWSREAILPQWARLLGLEQPAEVAA